VVGVEPLEAGAQGRVDPLWGVVVDGAATFDADAELGGDDGVVATAAQRFAESPLALAQSVGVGGVEEGEATVEGDVDGVEEPLLRDIAPAVAAHRAAAEGEARDAQIGVAEEDGFHQAFLPAMWRVACWIVLTIVVRKMWRSVVGEMVATYCSRRAFFFCRTCVS